MVRAYFAVSRIQTSASDTSLMAVEGQASYARSTGSTNPDENVASVNTNRNLLVSFSASAREVDDAIVAWVVDNAPDGFSLAQRDVLISHLERG